MHSLFLLKVPVQEKGIQIHILFFSQGQTNSSTFSNRVPMERNARLQGLFYMSQIPYKITLNKEIYPISQRPLAKGIPPMFPKSRAPMETDVHFHSLT